METKSLDALSIATTIAAAWAGNRPNLSAYDAVTFFGDVYDGVSAKLSPPPPTPPEPILTPAVPIRQSIKPDFIVCLEDGKKFKSLKRHLRTHFDMTPEQYRERWGLPKDYPMVAPNYSAKRSQLAKDNGLGTKGVSH